MSGLFDPITTNGLALKNRIVMPPMATRIAGDEGKVNDGHIHQNADWGEKAARQLEREPVRR